MKKLEKIRTLETARPSQEGRPCFVSAASGLVRVGGFWFVNADDETHMARFPADDSLPGEFFEVLPGPTLPLEHRPRKKAKPDLEALTVIERTGGASLLAVPSGSKANRVKGAVIPCFERGALGPAKIVDFGALYEEIARRVGPLNIEGAVMRGERLLLFNRGNAADSVSAVISVAGAAFAQVNDGSEAPPAILSIHEMDLGEIEGHPLGFTDACLGSHGELLFLAAAEGVKDSYEDGAYLGAVIGALDEAGRILHRDPIDCPMKPEGLWLLKETGRVRIVTDCDDITRAAEMFELKM